MIMKAEKMFMIFEPNGKPNYHTIRRQKQYSIASWFTKEQWKEARKYGWTCKKVEVSINIL